MRTIGVGLLGLGNVGSGTLGPAQMAWAKQQLESSQAAWKVIGNEVMMMNAEVGGGAQRWLDLGPLNLQPSELMKPVIVLDGRPAGLFGGGLGRLCLNCHASPLLGKQADSRTRPAETYTRKASRCEPMRSCQAQETGLRR